MTTATAAAGAALRERGAEAASVGDEDLSLTSRFPQLEHRQHLNEVPFGPLAGVEDAVRAVLAHSAHYPDNDHTDLIEDLAAYLDVDPALVAVGAGGTALIQQILLASITAADQEVVFGWPSFDGYPILTKQVRAIPVAVPLVDAAQDLAAMAAAITPRTRVLFVCSPNNPTGTEVDEHELEQFLARVPARVTVVVDLAYIEFSARYLADPDRPGRGRAPGARPSQRGGTAHLLQGLRPGDMAGGLHPRRRGSHLEDPKGGGPLRSHRAGQARRRCRAARPERAHAARSVHQR
jgi:DNA-binding transcriptional MocR family regulator